jgi:hypothetical protein
VPKKQPPKVSRTLLDTAAKHVALDLEALLREGDVKKLREIDYALAEHEKLVKEWRGEIAEALAKSPQKGG